MQLLIPGGGAFLGAAALDAALARGHSVTVLNRGRARNAWPDGVEVLTGDRNAAGGLNALAGRRCDGVIDTCAYVPTDVQASAESLRSCGRYLFVSSVSAYASFGHAPVRVADALANPALAGRRRRPHAGARRAGVGGAAMHRSEREAALLAGWAARPPGGIGTGEMR